MLATLTMTIALTGNAILVDYITLGLAWRNGQILPHNVAPDIFRARFGLERNFCQPPGAWGHDIHYKSNSHASPFSGFWRLPASGDMMRRTSSLIRRIGAPGKTTERQLPKQDRRNGHFHFRAPDFCRGRSWRLPLTLPFRVL